MLLFATIKVRNHILASSYFVLEKIDLETTGRISRKAILKASGVAVGSSILGMNIDLIQKGIEALPMVRSVRVTRTLPNSLKIEVKPEIPYALVNEKRLHFMNDEGKTFDQVRMGDNLNLPLVTIEGGHALKDLHPGASKFHSGYSSLDSNVQGREDGGCGRYFPAK